MVTIPDICDAVVFGKCGWLIDSAPSALNTPNRAIRTARMMPTTRVPPDIRKLRITNAAMPKIPAASTQFSTARTVNWDGFGGSQPGGGCCWYIGGAGCCGGP